MKEAIKVTRLNKDNINEYSGLVSEIYKDGYLFNSKTNKGFYPHNFVYYPEKIVSTINNHSESVFWDYIEKNNNPLSSLMGYLEKNELEIKALVNTTNARQEKKTYTLYMGNYLSDTVLEFLNNPNVHRVIAEPIIFSPQVLSHTAATDAFPIGYAPYHILIQTPKFKFKEFKGDLDACMFDRNHFYRKNELTNEDSRYLRAENYSLKHVFPLVEMVSSFAGVKPPKIMYAQDMKNKNTEVKVFEIEPINSLFYQTKQAFKTFENDWAYACKNINDNSSFIDFSDCINNSNFKSLLETILKANKDTRMLHTRIPQTIDNLYKQEILIDEGFKPIIFIPGGAGEGIDSVSFVKHKRITLKDKIISGKIRKYHNEYLQKSLDKGYLADFKGYDAKLYERNFNRHINMMELVLSKYFQ
ncbi:MAG: hypothetical protein PHN56_00780 [Candidatus Nanoarchaeia archaeon]|nr:hypothetical protein [Candidatus Nanoarchaeia archaeon]